jgi:TnpA family transposase
MPQPASLFGSRLRCVRFPEQEIFLDPDIKADPKVCYVDTHGFTEVVMATAALLGYELAPRIKDIKDQTLYKIDRQQHYANLDSILSGTIKPHLIRNAWDETVRVIASIEERIVSPSLVLHRLGSYARQNSVYQALSEIGRVQKTVHILKTLDDEDYRRRMGRELNKGEASHDLSRSCVLARKACSGVANSATRRIHSVVYRSCTMLSLPGT